MGFAEELDLVNRDPNSLNDHVKVAFEDVLAEPDGAHSIDCVWKLSYLCFNCCKGCAYKILTLCCGICIACAWGCEFATIAFDHVWYWTPLLRIFSIYCGTIQKVWGICLSCCLQPCCETLGYCFSNIRVTNVSG